MINLSSEAKFCFATLALGKRYRILAQKLANDLEKYSPDTPFLILTDRISDFKKNTNVLAFQHWQRLWCDNDKSILIGKALSLFDCCICIDADMRILSPVSLDIEKLPVGITAKSCCSLLKHTTKRQSNPKKLAFLKNIAHKLELDLKNQEIKWVHEFLFVVKKGQGKELEFIKLFEMISRYLELNKIYIGAGSAMGLAAAKFGIPIQHHSLDGDSLKGINFFKDRIELEKMKVEKKFSSERLVELKEIQFIERPQYSLPQKVVFKLNGSIKNLLRSIHLRLDTLTDFGFYYF